MLRCIRYYRESSSVVHSGWLGGGVNGVAGWQSAVEPSGLDRSDLSHHFIHTAYVLAYQMQVDVGLTISYLSREE